MGGPSLSATKAPLLLPPSCPAKFKQVIDNPLEPTAVMEFGSLVHALLLDEGDQIMVIDAADYKTKAAQEARVKARLNGNIPALPHEVEKAVQMVDAVRTHPLAGPLFEDGTSEYSLSMTDPETGVLLRGRVDWMTMIDGRVVLVEYKTGSTAYPQTWARKSMDYGYHIQAAWYRWIAIQLGIDDDPIVRHVVGEKEPPYLVSVIDFDTEAILRGTERMREAIDIYHRCWLADEWPGYTEMIYTVSLPP